MSAVRKLQLTRNRTFFLSYVLVHGRLVFLVLVFMVTTGRGFFGMSVSLILVIQTLFIFAFLKFCAFICQSVKVS